VHLIQPKQGASSIYCTVTAILRNSQVRRCITQREFDRRWNREWRKTQYFQTGAPMGYGEPDLLFHKFDMHGLIQNHNELAAGAPSKIADDRLLNTRPKT
jgi:hypothetical protein